MNDIEYRVFLDLMMCSDPWPVDDGVGMLNTNSLMNDVANRLAVDRGYASWIEAYHEHEA